ncbi:MAG: VWA domain-containing protein [Pyrinomonadaceae bacterium]
MTRTLITILVASLLLGSALLSAVGQATSRARRTENEQQQQPKQQPTPKPQGTPREDEVDLKDDEVVRVETDLTNILFTAADKQRHFITTLKQEDIRIIEDGQPQEIFTFARQVDLPLSLAILIDTSGSEERTLPSEKAAAKAFTDSVVRPDKDEVAIISFTGEVTLEQGLTSSLSRIRQALDRVEYIPPAGSVGPIPGTPPINGNTLAGWTAIWDAIWVTSDEVLSKTSDKTRRAIILLTDGQDTKSMKKMSDAIDHAVKADAVIYCIGIGDEYMSGINEGALNKLAEKTGGRAFFPHDDESKLRAAFAQIQQELRSQYLIAYSPTNKSRDGSFRKVQIELLNPELRKNLKLTYRQGYFAKTTASQ